MEIRKSFSYLFLHTNRNLRVNLGEGSEKGPYMHCVNSKIFGVGFP